MATMTTRGLNIRQYKHFSHWRPSLQIIGVSAQTNNTHNIHSLPIIDKSNRNISPDVRTNSVCTKMSPITTLFHTRAKSTDTTNMESTSAGPAGEPNHYTTTHFGFTTVPEEEKAEKVYEVFKKVAETYDLMNDVMSAGVHRLWKDEFVRQLAPHEGMNLIDVAGGTGDIAFRYMKYSDGKNAIDISNRLVTVSDINEHMLGVGERRAIQQGLTQGISWLQGNAECLPVESNTFDAFTIAFGIRNCTNVKKVLSEAHRVLKPGGRFMCLEFSQLTNSVLQSAYDQYSFQVIPVLGHVIANDWASYQYLVESIRKFPDQVTFAEWITEAGFTAVSWNNLTFGIAAIHSGFKL